MTGGTIHSNLGQVAEQQQPHHGNQGQATRQIPYNNQGHASRQPFYSDQAQPQYQNYGGQGQSTYRFNQTRSGGTISQKCFFCGITGHIATNCNLMNEYRMRGIFHRRGGQVFLGPPGDQGREIPLEVFNQYVFNQASLILAVVAIDYIP